MRLSPDTIPVPEDDLRDALVPGRGRLVRLRARQSSVADNQFPHLEIEELRFAQVDLPDGLTRCSDPGAARLAFPRERCEVFLEFARRE